MTSEEGNIEEDSAGYILPPTAKQDVSAPTTINIPPSIEIMEVHKHPHHVTHKKNWGEYLLEFLMLFLAVFLGFVAENIREHSVERSKEKEYIQSMMEDLQNDTTKLSKVDNSLLIINKSIDTILMNYNEMPKGANPTLFRNIKAIYNYPTFIYSDRTIQQLKSSGGMLLIKNKKAADGIMDYDAFVRSYEIDGAYVERYWENLTFQRLNIIDQESLDNDLKLIGTVDTKKNYLAVSDPVQLHRLKSFVYELKTYHTHTLNANKKLRDKAIRLFEILKNEYHLE